MITLKDFYNDYRGWLENDAPESSVFTRNYGLCANLYDWGFSKGLPGDEVSGLLTEMHDQFEREGFDHTLPFNDSDTYSMPYVAEQRIHSCYKNKQRRKWIMDHSDKEVN